MSTGCSQPLIVDIDAFSGYICPAVIGQLLGQYQTRLSCHVKQRRIAVLLLKTHS